MARAAKKSSPSKRPSLAKVARAAVGAVKSAVARKETKPGKPAAKKPVPAPKAKQAKAPAKPKVSPKPAPTKAEPKAAPAKVAAKAPAVVKASAPVAKPEPAPAPTPPPKPKVKPVPEVSKDEIAGFKRQLEELRTVYEREIADLEAAFDEMQSELSGEAAFDEEYADAGSFTFERERDLSLGNNIRDLLDRVNHALVKVGDGSYGLCDRCGNAIHRARLEALPYVNLCVTCKHEEEHVR